MDSTGIFWMQLLLSCVVCALVMAWYVCRSSGVGGQHVGIRGPAKWSARRLALERPEFQPEYSLVYLYVLRSPGNHITFDDLLDFGQV